MVVGADVVHCGTFGGLAVLCPLDDFRTSSLHLVPRLCQTEMSLDAAKCPLVLSTPSTTEDLDPSITNVLAAAALGLWWWGGVATPGVST